MKLNVDKFRVQCAVRNTTGAHVARHVGYTKQWLHSIKNHSVTARPKIAQKMASFLRVKVEDIFDEVSNV